MREVVLSDRARADLKEIWHYTYNRWNETQAIRYLGRLDAGIERLASEPSKGRQRDAVRRGYWSRRIEHHVVYYTLSDTTVRVQRVLHEVMDADLHL